MGKPDGIGFSDHGHASRLLRKPIHRQPLYRCAEHSARCEKRRSGKLNLVGLGARLIDTSHRTGAGVAIFGVHDDLISGIVESLLESTGYRIGQAGSQCLQLCPSPEHRPGGASEPLGHGFRGAPGRQ